MKELIFATHNTHKLEEVQNILINLKIKSLTDIGFHEDIVEDGNSFQQNAEIKVNAVIKYRNKNVFADDSGLVIPALNDAPGIYSSRYAGTGNSEDNIQKVLSELKDVTDREAYFITVICLYYNQQKYFFQGKVHGVITTDISGTKGFGYDPIFRPNGYDVTFAQLPATEKNSISHRSNALKKMVSFLNKHNLI